MKTLILGLTLLTSLSTFASFGIFYDKELAQNKTCAQRIAEIRDFTCRDMDEFEQTIDCLKSRMAGEALAGKNTNETINLLVSFNKYGKQHCSNSQ